MVAASRASAAVELSRRASLSSREACIPSLVTSRLPPPQPLPSPASLAQLCMQPDTRREDLLARVEVIHRIEQSSLSALSCLHELSAPQASSTDRLSWAEDATDSWHDPAADEAPSVQQGRAPSMARLSWAMAEEPAVVQP